MDIRTAYDYTIRDPNELENAYVGKQKKYGNSYFEKPINPIVVSYGITIHQLSLTHLLELNKFNAIIPMIASRLVKGHFDRLVAYSGARTLSTAKSADFFDQQAQTANPRGYQATMRAIQEENSRKLLSLIQQHGGDVDGRNQTEDQEEQIQEIQDLIQ